MEVLPVLRRAALMILVAAVVAGCASPPEENRPGDANCDGDRDGIPDGQSPVEGANSTCDEGPTDGTVPADDAGVNETEPTMPGVLP